MLRTISLTCAALALAGGAAFAQDSYTDPIPPGTHVRVRVDQTIDARDTGAGRVFPATVVDDVHSVDGHMVIPRGARAEVIVDPVGSREMTIDLESITVNGRRYMVDANTYETGRSGLGNNRRTGEYVGGGALFGTIIGAIAGGGKGAAIGALAGGAAGAGAQVATRGEHLYVPAESVIEFRLERPLHIAHGQWERDNGYDRDGYHYHNDYYRRDRQ